MMGGFEGFDHAWGYHWVGWPMLRSLVGSVMPWTSLGDGVALHLLRALVAIWVGECLFRQLRSILAAWVGLLTVLLNRGWFCSMAFLYRPETLTALLLWMAALPLIGKREDSSKITAGLSVVSLVLLPLMHPLAWPASMLVAFMGSVTIRRSAGTMHWIRRSFLRWWLPLMLGFGLFGGYYLSDPLRLAQFKDTLQTTAHFKSGLEATVRRLFLDPKNVFLSVPVLAVLGLSLLALRFSACAWKAWLWDGLGLSLAMVLLSMAYLFAAGHPNTGHATVMAPFLGYSAGRLFNMDWRSSAERWLTRLGMIGQVALCSLPLLLTAGSFLFHPPGSSRTRATTVLDRALASTRGRVIIPLSMWEAAGAVSGQDRSRIRFATFPNWVLIGRRLAYEDDVVNSLAEGDVLIVDGTPSEPYDPANVLPWPRTAKLRGEGGWIKLEEFDPIVNTTLSIGRLHRQEMLLGPMTLLRYQAAN
ncbi:MAG: hypothetical protein CFE44_15535 [Burkholderiales bacterium PBB4]|nr:MAG: hypothetical protein CFE44_15535 [Burkholderiales bacterium PBB4]